MGPAKYTFPEQGDRDDFSTCLFFSNITVNGITYSSHKNFLEQYNPKRFSDVQYWLPKGLMNDLMDNAGETFPVTDNVSGYTNAQFYRALMPDVKGMNSYREKLLEQNSNNQANNVNLLFQEYGY